MKRIWTIARHSLRWIARGASLALAILTVLLGGYYLGWQSVPAEKQDTQPSASAPVRIAQPRPSMESVSGEPAAPTTPTPVAETDAERVARLANWLVTGRDRRASDARVTAEIAAMSIPEIWAALEELHSAPKSPSGSELRSKLLLRWAAVDGSGAFSYWHQSMKSLRWPRDLANSFFDRWAKQDAVAALGGWKTLVSEGALPDYEQDYPLRRIISRMANRDLSQAADEARRFEGDHLSAALRGLADVGHRAETRAELLETFQDWPPGKTRDEALAQTVVAWARAGERDEALAWLEQSALDPEMRFEVADDIGMDLFHQNHTEGADWLVAQAKTPDQRSRALAHITINWMQYDLFKAGDWLVAQGLDESAARAMRLYADKLTLKFPQEAVVWAQAIPDAVIRQKALAQVEEHLRQRHPTRAEEILRLAGE